MCILIAASSPGLCLVMRNVIGLGSIKKMEIRFYVIASRLDSYEKSALDQTNGFDELVHIQSLSKSG